MTSSCAGRGCSNNAHIILRLRYLNLVGTFCESCAKNLITDGLAVAEEKGREPASLPLELVSSTPVPQVAAQRSLTP